MSYSNKSLPSNGEPTNEEPNYELKTLTESLFTKVKHLVRKM